MSRPPRTPRPSPPAGNGQPQLVGDVLSRFLARTGLEARVEAAGAVEEWAGTVGPQIAAVTQPLRVSDGSLFVAVSTSAWMMELTLMKGEILRRLNAGKKEGKIEHIVFVMGS